MDASLAEFLDDAVAEVAVPAGPGKVMVDPEALSEAWRVRVEWHAQQPLELLPPAPVKVAQPSLRHRGPRRGHVGARRRPGTRRVTTTRAGPRTDDPHQGDDEDEHRRAVA